MRDAAPVQFALKFSLKLDAIIRPYALDRQLLRCNIIRSQRQESGRCVTLRLYELCHLEEGAVVHENDDVAVPAETQCFIGPPTSTNNRCPLTLALSPVFFGTACRFTLAWKHVSHAPHWPVVSIPIVSAVFLVMSLLGCASLRWTSTTSRDAPALVASVVPEAILTNPFSVRFASRASSCLGIRLAVVTENSPLRGQNLKTNDSSPGNPKTALSL